MTPLWLFNLKLKLLFLGNMIIFLQSKNDNKTWYGRITLFGGRKRELTKEMPKMTIAFLNWVLNDCTKGTLISVS